MVKEKTAADRIALLDKRVGKLKTELEQTRKRLNEELDKNTKPPLRVQAFLDSTEIVGMGSAEINDRNYRVSRVNAGALIKMVKTLIDTHDIFNTLSNTEKKDTTIDIAIADNAPVIIGKYNKNRNTISGMIIAPRVGEE